MDGKTLHSKLRTGDFPDFDAILKSVKSMLLNSVPTKFDVLRLVFFIQRFPPESMMRAWWVVAVFKTTLP